MLTVSLCHACEDGELAAGLATFLEHGTGARIFLEEGVIRPGQDLIAKVNDGRMAEAVVALLSAASSPSRWPLERWQQAFWHGPAEDNVPVAILLAGECRFPELLRRRNFFEMAGGRLAAFREIKRWIMARHALPERPFLPAATRRQIPGEEVERIAVTLADKPGAMTVPDPALALAFAARHAGEFEAVFWACAGGAGHILAGDLGAQAGLPADARPEETAASLGRLCAGHRFLVLLDGCREERLGLYQPEGLTSVLAVDGPGVEVPPDLEAGERRLLEALAVCARPAADVLAAVIAQIEPERADSALEALEARGLVLRPDARFRRWLTMCEMVPDPGLAARHAVLAARGDDLAAAQRAFAWATAGGGWALAVETGRRAFSLASSAGRLAEACDVLEALGRAAKMHPDDEVEQWTVRERCRILDRWEMFEESAALRQAAGAYCGLQQGFEW